MEISMLRFILDFEYENKIIRSLVLYIIDSLSKQCVNKQ